MIKLSQEEIIEIVNSGKDMTAKDIQDTYRLKNKKDISSLYSRLTQIRKFNLLNYSIQKCSTKIKFRKEIYTYNSLV